MIKLDSITILLPRRGVVKDFSKSYFNVFTTETPEGIEVNKDFRLKNIIKIEGLKSIIINHSKNQIKIELSSKILKENSIQLINMNNTVEVFRQLNSTGIVNINIQRAIDKAIVFKFDLTNDLKAKNEISDYISALNVYRINSDYEVKSYKNESVTFKKNTKTVYERISFYDKFAESGEDSFSSFLKNQL